MRQKRPKVAVHIQAATPDDLAEVQAIYAHYVTHTTVSLEEVPPTVAEIQERWQHSFDRGLPYLVAKEDDRVVGYAYAFPYRPRSAYRYTIEESVYVAPEHAGKGIGKLLLQEIITQCTRQGYKQMLAVIAGQGNHASIALHQALGFVQCGVIQSAGYKHEQWLDTVLLQKALV